MKHEPKTCYDCTNCKFQWNCGTNCTCELARRGFPPATGELAKKVRAAHLKVDANWEGQPIDGIEG